MKIGDIVQAYSTALSEMPIGIVVGFNKKGEGGQDYVHVLTNCGEVEVFLSEVLVVVDKESSQDEIDYFGKAF